MTRHDKGMTKARMKRAASFLAVIAGLCCGAWWGIAPAQSFEFLGFKLFENGEEEPAAPVPDPLPYDAQMSVTGEVADIREKLLETSQLIQETDSPPSGEPGLIARALGDRQQLIAQLYVAGLYGGTVEITIGGVPLQKVVETGDVRRRAGQPVSVVIRIETGPQFRFGDVSVRALAADGAGPQQLNPSEYGLVSGAPALSDAILEAERRLVDSLRAEGHPLAKIADRSVVADHATRLLDVAITAAPGPAATIGTVTVRGAEHTDTDFILSQAGIEPGSRYNPEELRKAAARLQALGIFGRIRMIESERLDAGRTLPIVIEVAERKRQVIGGGATISSVEGIGVEGYWRHRNLFGRGEQLSIEGSAARIGDGSPGDLEYSGRVIFMKPGVFGPATRFTAELGARRENPKPYDSRSVYGNFRLTTQHSDVLEYSGGAEVSHSREDDVLGTNNYTLFGAFGEVIYDSRDDKLDPTEGARAVLFLEPAYDAGSNGAMVFARASASAYRSLDDAKRFVLAARAATGSIFGSSLGNVPPSRRYYLGGGGSVRGYAYRNIGPRVAGEVVGGLSFIEASAELRARVTEKFGLVAFVDAGAAYRSEIPDFSEDLKVGVGAGVRYYSPIGPLRFDFAVPLAPDKDDPDFAIYVGLSQAF
jgi:translocation and assembly module TamA